MKKSLYLATFLLILSQLAHSMDIACIDGDSVIVELPVSHGEVDFKTQTMRIVRQDPQSKKLFIGGKPIKDEDKLFFVHKDLVSIDNKSDTATTRFPLGLRDGQARKGKSGGFKDYRTLTPAIKAQLVPVTVEKLANTTVRPDVTFVQNEHIPVLQSHEGSKKVEVVFWDHSARKPILYRNSQVMKWEEKTHGPIYWIPQGSIVGRLKDHPGCFIIDNENISTHKRFSQSFFMPKSEEEKTYQFLMVDDFERSLKEINEAGDNKEASSDTKVPSFGSKKYPKYLPHVTVCILCVAGLTWHYVRMKAKVSEKDNDKQATVVVAHE